MTLRVLCNLERSQNTELFRSWWRCSADEEGVWRMSAELRAFGRWLGRSVWLCFQFRCTIAQRPARGGERLFFRKENDLCESAGTGGFLWAFLLGYAPPGVRPRRWVGAKATLAPWEPAGVHFVGGATRPDRWET